MARFCISNCIPSSQRPDQRYHQNLQPQIPTLTLEGLICPGAAGAGILANGCYKSRTPADATHRNQHSLQSILRCLDSAGVVLVWVQISPVYGQSIFEP